jgi:hypothetical protein
MLGKGHESCYDRLELQLLKSMFSAFYKYASLGYAEGKGSSLSPISEPCNSRSFLEEISVLRLEAHHHRNIHSSMI